MEGKELVSKLLVEHTSFLGDITSLQIDGISSEDINSPVELIEFSTLFTYIF